MPDSGGHPDGSNRSPGIVFWVAGGRQKVHSKSDIARGRPKAPKMDPLVLKTRFWDHFGSYFFMDFERIPRFCHNRRKPPICLYISIWGGSALSKCYFFMRLLQSNFLCLSCTLSWTSFYQFVRHPGAKNVDFGSCGTQPGPEIEQGVDKKLPF